MGLINWIGISLAIFSCNSFAFSWARCDKELGTLPLNGGGFVSSSQFTSSSGGCRAIGKIEEKMKFFLVNFEKIKNDVAKGDGEHVLVFIYNRCIKADYITLINDYKNSFEYFFETSKKTSYERVEALIKDHCSTELEIKKVACN